jgi:hypothetical protein
MGNKLMDQYSYLHFSVGVIFYFWGFTLRNWIIIQILFEILENTNIGIKLINKTNIWPGGGKIKSDYTINIIGDIIFGTLGWISAYYLDKVGNKYGWYDMHIKK